MQTGSLYTIHDYISAYLELTEKTHKLEILYNLWKQNEFSNQSLQKLDKVILSSLRNPKYEKNIFRDIKFP